MRGRTTMPVERSLRGAPALGAMIVLCMCVASQAVFAQERRVPDTFTATTAEMTQAGITLKVDVLEWSDDDARAAVIAALTGAAEESGSLARLPTIGYVWTSGSGVGYALKYAHRMQAPGDGERVTVVTDRRLGAYSFHPWSAEGRSSETTPDYSVIELYLDDEGRGVGTMSLAADVIFDGDSGLVSLAEGATHVLSEAKREPKPYWAQGS
jgi:hypothetical protein